MFKERNALSVAVSGLNRRWAPALTAMLCVSTATAEQTTKMYFNKSQNPENYIVLKNDVENTIKYTTDGIELDFPGVDITLR
ncbi:hypothetical protein OAS73_04900, partial [Luminiphilus sp.]|nr:hypothetical protein [Luminiphilus sp.]